MSLLDFWKRRGGTSDDGRWVVLDVESSGLDARRDRLLAIAAIALRRGDAGPAIALGDSFEVVLRQQEAPVDKANILLHGIGVGAQRAGAEPRAALEAFVAWLGASPLIAFHSAFDETMIGRALRGALGRRVANAWIDLEHVAEVVQPAVRARSLDEWMAHYGIVCAVRHQAAADTLATAELLLRLWPAIRAAGADGSFASLQELAAQRKWLQH